MSEAFHTETITHAGREFSVECYYDDHMGPPWEEHDGYGPVSEWRYRDTKRPGEIPIAGERDFQRRFYDFAEATRIAKRDGWGLGGTEAFEFACKIGRIPTRKQIIREAVMRDMERLRGWCNDKWHWMGVEVTLLNRHGEETRFSESVWGIESDGDYWREVAEDCAANALHEYEKAQKLAKRVAWLGRTTGALSRYRAFRVQRVAA